MTPVDRMKARMRDPTIAKIARAFRQGAVEALLASNDTQCFTVEQYKDAYDKQWEKDGVPRVQIPRDLLWRDGIAEAHLQSLPDLVREIREGKRAAEDFFSSLGRGSTAVDKKKTVG